jgi:hypothetical protein
LGKVTPLRPPERLTAEHETTAFDCGRVELDDWLKRHALANEGRALRTYVVADDTKVVGFYSLAAGSVLRDGLPRKFRHSLPESVPVMVLGGLATDVMFQGRGVGGGMLKDALLRSIGVSGMVGVRAIFVHAIDDAATGFYLPFGFAPSPVGERTLILPIETAIRALG